MASKLVRKQIKDKRLNEAFNQMLGAGPLNLNIVYPKYLNIKHYLVKIHDLIKVFVDTPFMKSLASAEAEKVRMVSFVMKIEAELKSLFSMNFDIEVAALKILPILKNRLMCAFFREY